MFGRKLASIDHRNASRSPLKSFKRATGLVRGNPNFSTLEITDMFQASWLAKLAKSGRVVGTGVAVIDFGSRAVSVAGASAAGENVYRETFIEMSSFAASATTGLVGAQIGGAALAILLAATPPGWVVVIVSIGIAGVVGGAAMGMDYLVKHNAGAVYDSIMNSVSALWAY